MLKKPKSESIREAKKFQYCFFRIEIQRVFPPEKREYATIVFLFKIQLNCKTKGEVNWCRLVVSFKQRTDSGVLNYRQVSGVSKKSNTLQAK
jgi:hypothetical protein